MRLITVALGSVLAAAPAFAAGHGHAHAAPKPGSQTSTHVPKANSDGDKTFRMKKSDYEKRLQATEKESDQIKGHKVKGLTHPPVEASDMGETAKGARAAEAREAPPPKIKGNGIAGVAPPSVRGSAQGGAPSGAH